MCRPLSLSHRPRCPESTVLHAVVREHLETFLAERRGDGGDGCPRFLEESFHRYLRCGLLCHGFARVRCEDETLVGFSCKSRVCPSCLARRMSETAAYLRDELLPEVPYRQWVLTVPWALRARLSVDRRLLSDVFASFLRLVFAWLRRRDR